MEHDIPPVQDFSDLIYKMANQYRHKLPAGTGYELDDLVAEGYLVYCQAIQKFDPERASFMTLFHLMLWQHFNGLVRALNQNCRAGWYQDNEDIGSRIDIIVDVSEPTIHSHLNDKFFERLTRRAAMFIRELLYSSDGFRKWEIQNFKYQAHTTSSKIGRVARYLGMSGTEKSEVVRELRTKLTDDTLAVAC